MSIESLTAKFAADAARPAALEAPEPLRRSPDMDTPLPLILLSGGLVGALIVIPLLPIRDSYFGTLLFQRGWFQYGSLYLAACVLGFIALRAIRVAKLAADVSAADLPDLPSLPDVSMERYATVRDDLIGQGSYLSLRRARALQGFVDGGNTQSAGREAEGDAALAETAMDTSYAVPRAFVWAIPLIGFIGTVVGISLAVSSFTGFLQQAEEIEQIKNGISGVTTGLAVAFDTTLVALLLSVLVMLPLVLMERFEQRTLLRVEADVRSAVVARLVSRPTVSGMSADEARGVVTEVILQHLPSPEAIVGPATAYLEKAAAEVGAAAHSAAVSIGDTLERALSQQNEALRLQRAWLQQAHDDLEARGREMVAETQRRQQSLESTAFAMLRQVEDGQLQSIATLDRRLETTVDAIVGAARLLETRLETLGRVAADTSEVIELQKALTRSVEELTETGQLATVLNRVDASLQRLLPAIERASAPRRITFVEAEEQATPVRGAPVGSTGLNRNGDHGQA